MEVTSGGGDCFEWRNRLAVAAALEAAEHGSTAVAAPMATPWHNNLASFFSAQCSHSHILPLLSTNDDVSIFC